MFLVEELGSMEKQKKPVKKGRQNNNALSSEESNSDLDDDFDDLNLGSSSSNSNLSKDAADDSTFSHSNRSNKRHNQFYLNPNTTFHFHSTTLPNGAISDLADPDKYPYNQIKVAKKDFKNKNLSVNQCLKFQSTKNDKLSETDKLTFSQLLGFQKRILSIIVEPIYLNSFSFELSRRDFEDKDEIKNRLELITDLCLSRGEFIKYQEKLKTQVKYQNDLVELKDRLLVFLKVDNEKSSVGEYLRSSVGEGDFIVGFGDNDPLTTTKSINKALNRHKLFSKIDKLYKKHFQNSETNLSDYKYYEAKNLAAGKVSYQIKDHFKKQLIKGPLCLMDRRSSREIEEENLRYKSFMV